MQLVILIDGCQCVFQLPTMTGGGKGTRSQRLKMIFWNNIGMFIGVAILICISLFEEKIKIE